jgi:hypothetical protein
VRTRLALALGGGATLLVAAVVAARGAIAHTARDGGADAAPDTASRLFVDYDGDGQPEVIVEAAGHFEIDTMSAGRVVPYPPARGIDFDDVCDVDADGRFDLMTRGPYASIPEVPAMFVAHARADGTFSERDDVARQALRVTCSDVPMSSKDLARHLVCARLHGVSAETLRARLADAGAPVPDWVDQVLAVPPILRLP